MKYLVTMEVIEAKVPTDPRQLVYHVEQVIKQHEVQIKLEAEKKILAGGMPVGKRADVFIVDAESNEELNRLLMSFPNWAIMKVDVTPLADFEVVNAEVRQVLEQMKAAQK